MYAFHHQPPAGATLAYACYLSDLTTVWADSSNSDEIAAHAKKLGLSKVDTDALAYLTKELESAFYDERVQFERVGAEYHLSVSLPDGLNWQMRLQKMDAHNTAKFFASLNASQFANHSYLAYKVAQLEKALRAKDKYILYLEENYRTVNGSELMDKYRRQHASDTFLLEPYSRGSFDARVHEQYNSLARRLETDPSSWSGLLWDVISSVFQDMQTWVAGHWIYGNDDEAITSEKVKKETAVKSKPSVKSEPQVKSDPQVKSEPSVEAEPIERPSAVKSEPASEYEVSPAKRRRVGYLGRRPAAKKENADSTNDAKESESRESPKGRKRLGVIGIR
ncbi:hypothetical protein FDK38_003346 [Candidozyma auris]|nr:hypothetical protein FDK38_003346 [[Candida] auris]